MSMKGPFGPRPETGSWGYIDDNGKVRVVEFHVVVFKWCLDCARWSYATGFGIDTGRTP